MPALLLDLDDRRGVAVRPERKPHDIRSEADQHDARDLKGEGDFGPMKALGVERHQNEPAGPQHEHDRHQDFVPALLVALDERAQALAEQGRVVAGEPKPAAEAWRR